MQPKSRYALTPTIQTFQTFRNENCFAIPIENSIYYFIFVRALAKPIGGFESWILILTSIFIRCQNIQTCKAWRELIATSTTKDLAMADRVTGWFRCTSYWVVYLNHYIFAHCHTKLSIKRGLKGYGSLGLDQRQVWSLVWTGRGPVVIRSHRCLTVPTLL